MVDGKKLSILLKRKKIKSEDLIVKLKEYNIDLSIFSIKQYRVGNIAIPLVTIEAIADILDCSELDLLENSKEKIRKVVNNELKNNFGNYIDHIPSVTLPSNLKKVKFNHGYPSANKIVMENNMQNAEHIFIDKLMLSKEYQEQELKAVVMINDAMSPYLNHGDVAIYTPSTSYTVKGKYVISSTDGLEIISIEKLKKCGSLVLRPENPTYSTETFAKDEQDLVEFVGMVVARVSRS